MISLRSKFINGCKIHPESKIIFIKNSKNPSCEQCNEDKRKERQKLFIDRSNIIHKNKYSYNKVIYEKNYQKVIITCPFHGDFTQEPSNHVRGQGCDICLNQSLTYSQDEVLSKFKEVHRTVYDYSKVNYINWKSKLTIICKKHGEFFQAAGKHINGQGCPKCKMSHGERKIEHFLSKNNIQFINQKTFNDCVGIGNNKLKYDFYLTEHNILIEYDGEQHFKPRFDLGCTEDAIKRFNRLKELDKIKTRYAKKNNIFLIRISYKKLKTIEKTLYLLFKNILSNGESTNKQ